MELQCSFFQNFFFLLIVIYLCDGGSILRTNPHPLRSFHVSNFSVVAWNLARIVCCLFQFYQTQMRARLKRLIQGCYKVTMMGVEPMTLESAILLQLFDALRGSPCVKLQKFASTNFRIWSTFQHVNKECAVSVNYSWKCLFTSVN